MNTFVPRFLALALAAALVGCGSGPKSGKGFTLPDGDKAQGLEVFKQMRCYDCHAVSGVELPDAEEPDQTVIRLGGKVARIKTYGELVTSIINPSHRLARGYAKEQIVSEEGGSKMKTYNDVMTVNELIDLVAFLQSHYELHEYEPTRYAPLLSLLAFRQETSFHTHIWSSARWRHTSEEDSTHEGPANA